MLSHLNQNNQPSMVDISHKQQSLRTAIARATIHLPQEIISQLTSNNDLPSPKGPVFETARLAGVMAVKQTATLIPLCHPLPIDYVQINIHLDHTNSIVVIESQVKTTHKTGVEMEALTGATISALTIYDMCKALSHNMIISEIKLTQKTGGKNDYTENA